MKYTVLFLVTFLFSSSASASEKAILTPEEMVELWGYIYKNGVQKPFTGVYQQTCEDGGYVFRMEVLNGKAHGKFEMWDKDCKHKQSEEYFDQETPIGTHKKWINGELHKEIVYEKGTAVQIIEHTKEPSVIGIIARPANGS
ncbi:hypothetical protein [Pleionea sediminis]|uniref:hypothetical protein n=1 Tax=Pleionea sediminis TaxID=2569479 RepID=UPI001185C3EB|nr:hypothetical protein [Pleionea sediminis]